MLSSSRNRNKRVDLTRGPRRSTCRLRIDMWGHGWWMRVICPIWTTRAVQRLIVVIISGMWHFPAAISIWRLLVCRALGRDWMTGCGTSRVRPCRSWLLRVLTFSVVNWVILWRRVVGTLRRIAGTLGRITGTRGRYQLVSTSASSVGHSGGWLPRVFVSAIIHLMERCRRRWVPAVLRIRA